MTAPPLPKGRDLIPTKTAGEILGISPQGVRDLVHNGGLPPDGLYKIEPREIYFFERSSVEALAAKRAKQQKALDDRTRKKDKPAPKKPHISGSALALLSRLRRYADGKGFVDGDATDIVIGTPARPADWKLINELAKAGALEWSLDGWDRLTFTLNQEEEKYGHNQPA